DNILKLSKDDLLEIEDFGPIVAGSVYDWFHSKKNIELLNKLEQAGVVIDVSHLKVSEKKSALSGKTIVLTGSLTSLTREQAKAKIRELGGKVSSSVSKNTGMVVVGSDPGSKLEKAREYNIKVISEEKFLKIVK
ncbi:NAD-dependent DNA ligase LigA, partial [Candidatus Parcubacteria bacterium]|nr:NAD-dependent DNA ligase LigA [Candidatus Parcubacteria bacterium]